MQEKENQNKMKRMKKEVELQKADKEEIKQLKEVMLAHQE